MPRLAHALQGLFALLLLLVTACVSTTSAAPPPSPSPSPSPTVAPWVQDITLTGDVSTQVHAIAANEPQSRSECTGKNSRTASTWGSTTFWLLNGERWALVVLFTQYHGPGIYRENIVSLQVHNPDSSRVWHNEPGDPVAFQVAPDEESGTLEATLSNLTTGKGRLRLRGRWSCRT